MADIHITLRSALAESYDQLVQQLKRRLRSTDAAQDALHDTYLRLDRVPDSEVILKPEAYVMRVAINVARDHARRSRVRAPAAPLEAVIELANDAGSTIGQLEVRSDLKAISRALRLLPARRRKIFIAVCVEGLSPAEVGKRFGLKPRTIYKELDLARNVCAREIGPRKK